MPKTKKAENQLTVGWIRQQIEGLPDDTPVEPAWEEPPDDDEASVQLCGFHVRRPDGRPPELVVRVKLVYPEEPDDEWGL